jgi:hypothetical protein
MRFEVSWDRVGGNSAFVDVQTSKDDFLLALTLTPQGAKALARDLVRAAEDASAANREKKAGSTCPT